MVAAKWGRAVHRPARSSSPTRRTTSARSWPGARASRWRSATPRAGCCCRARRFARDATPIPGVRYDAEGVAVADIAYTYADAVRDGICRPVTFIPYDGTLQWRSGDDVIEAGFDTVLTTREASRRYRTAISAELADGLPRILAAAHAKLHEARAAGHRDAGGLVVAADSDHARKIAKLLKDGQRQVRRRSSCTPRPARTRSSQAFTDSRDEWIVAVNMVSEGVDIPRLRVGVYATAAKTPLIFRQVVGRFVRTIPGRPAEMSWLYLPGDPILRRHASDVDGELRHVLRRRECDEELFEERERRHETEKSEAVEFVALSADVSPTSQMSLFGGPAGRGAGARRMPAIAAGRSRRRCPTAARHATPKSRLSAFERRDILRDKRHRLVGDLGRRDRRPHARDQRVAEPGGRRHAGRGRDDRPARAVGLAAARRARGQGHRGAVVRSARHARRRRPAPRSCAACTSTRRSSSSSTCGTPPAPAPSRPSRAAGRSRPPRGRSPRRTGSPTARRSAARGCSRRCGCVAERRRPAGDRGPRGRLRRDAGRRRRDDRARDRRRRGRLQPGGRRARRRAAARRRGRRRAGRRGRGRRPTRPASRSSSTRAPTSTCAAPTTPRPRSCAARPMRARAPTASSCRASPTPRRSRRWSTASTRRCRPRAPGAPSVSELQELGVARVSLRAGADGRRAGGAGADGVDLSAGGVPADELNYRPPAA